MVMAQAIKIVPFLREGASEAVPDIDPAGYEEGKFAAPIKAFRTARALRARGKDVVIEAAFPSVLGDNYSEILQTLSLISDAGAMLVITRPQPNGALGPGAQALGP
jgi:hypothetical protein